MRLLVATPLYPPDPGGPATYAAILEHALPERGVQVATLSFGRVRHLPKVVRHVAYLFLLLRALYDADAVLTLDPVSVGAPALVASRILRKPFFVKVVGDYAWEQGTQRAGVRIPLDEFVRTKHVPPLASALRWVQATVAKGADRVIVPSAYLKGIVAAWGVPVERVTVVYNAMRPAVPGELPLLVRSASRPRVVSVGRLVPWKGMPGLVDAMATARAATPEATLAIAGDGPDRTTLEAYAHARLGQSALMLGALTPSDTLALIADADVFVLNSTYEGLSHVLIEALALGRPVIATAAGGNVELVEDGRNGLLVPPGDADALAAALGHLLATPKHREILGAAARKSAERFSIAAMADGTIEALGWKA